MHGLKSSNISINRKILADLAMNQPEVFAVIAQQAK
jgi:large subunit ribosomal protein L20